MISAPPSVAVLSIQQPLDRVTTTTICAGMVANEARAEAEQNTSGAVRGVVFALDTLVAEPERDPAPVGPLRGLEIRHCSSSGTAQCVLKSRVELAVPGAPRA